MKSKILDINDQSRYIYIYEHIIKIMQPIIQQFLFNMADGRLNIVRYSVMFDHQHLFFQWNTAKMRKMAGIYSVL